MASPRLDAEQARVLAAVKAEVAEYRKRNQYVVKDKDDKEVVKFNEPTFGFVESCVRHEASEKSLLDALVADVFEAVKK